MYQGEPVSVSCRILFARQIRIRQLTLAGSPDVDAVIPSEYPPSVRSLLQQSWIDRVTQFRTEE